MERKAHMHNRFFKKMKYGAMFDRIMEEDMPGQEDSSDVSSMIQSEEEDDYVGVKRKKSGAWGSDEDSNGNREFDRRKELIKRKSTMHSPLKRGATFSKNQRRRQRKKDKKKEI